MDNGTKGEADSGSARRKQILAKFNLMLDDKKAVLIQVDVYWQGDYLVTFDLKSAYYHIAIVKQTLVSVAWYSV